MELEPYSCNLPSGMSASLPFTFDFNVVHRAGVKYQVADALSRLQTTDADTKPIKDLSLSFAVINIDIIASTKDHLENYQQALAQVIEEKTSSK